MDRPLDRVLQELRRVTGQEPVASGGSFQTCCPGHEDTKPSLSVSEGDNGTVLIKCHAGCTAEAITSALGLQLRDLFPRVSRTSCEPRDDRGLEGGQANGKAARVYATAKEAADSLRERFGQETCKWAYQDASGQAVGGILRWDLPDGGKEIRPIAKFDDGWRVAAMPSPRPLYGLVALMRCTGRVYVCEGEKAADAAGSLGLTAITSSGGSSAARRTNWEPLAGREVVILPDADPAGQRYAGHVAALLSALSPPARVKIVDLPDLGEGNDIVEWIDSHGGAAEPDELRRNLESLVDTTPEWKPTSEGQTDTKPPRRIDGFQPFPVEALPDPLRSFVTAASRSIGCDPSYVALPLLSAVAGVIGLTRSISLKRGWVEPCVFWTAVVGEAATAKTPALQAGLKALYDRQGEALERHAEALRQFEVEQQCYLRDLSEWKRKRRGDDDDPPRPPPAPAAERFVVQDITPEALAGILAHNQRGVLVANDELASWIGGFDRYKSSKKAGDAASWLSMWSAGPLMVDRKSSGTIYVPRAAVSVAGGIQPRILGVSMAGEHTENGLLARLLLAAPPQPPRRWTEDEIPEAAERAIARLFDGIYRRLQPEIDENGRPRPVVLGPTSEGKRAWLDFFRQHAAYIDAADGHVRAALAKQEAYAARLALLIHCVRQVHGDDPPVDPLRVDAESFSAAATLMEWFRHEVARVYSVIDETDEQRSLRRVAEWIDHRGGRITARELQMGRRHVHTAAEAEALLGQLIKANYGEWDAVPTTERGGRPTRVYQSFGGSSVHTTPSAPGDLEVVQTFPLTEPGITSSPADLAAADVEWI